MSLPKFHFIFTEDKSTCCCKGVDNCCWNDCKESTGEGPDERCKLHPAELRNIEFSAVYWESVNIGTPEETHVLLGNRVIKYVRKFYSTQYIFSEIYILQVKQMVELS